MGVSLDLSLALEKPTNHAQIRDACSGLNLARMVNQPRDFLLEELDQELLSCPHPRNAPIPERHSRNGRLEKHRAFRSHSAEMRGEIAHLVTQVVQSPTLLEEIEDR